MRHRFVRSVGVFALLLFATPAFAQAAGFDPEAASQAYLSTLKGAARAKSDAYFEGGYWLLLWGALVAIASDYILLRFGWSARFRDMTERLVKRRWLQNGLYAAPYVLAGTVLTLPWTIYTGYVREKQYDLMNQSFPAWAGEQAISLGVAIIITALLLMTIFAVIRKSPKRWWLWGAGAMSLFTAFGAMIVPIFISPLFNTYTELKPGPVRDRIVAMAQAQHIPSEHIYVFDQSKQHKRISANVSGLGPTIRISLNDNLLNRTTLPETAAVMGHEMGHYVLGHVWKLIAAFSLVFLLLFWIASRIVPRIVARWGAAWGLRGVDDVGAYPVYAIVLSICGLILTPITNSIIRTNESEADAFGLDVAREPDGFALTAMKLSEYRKIEPGPIEEMLFFDHPSGATRVRMAMAWKAKHLAEAQAPKVEIQPNLIRL
jgi:STE24 endopeptidase